MFAATADVQCHKFLKMASIVINAANRAAKRWFGMPPKDMRRSVSHHPSSR
jgi:hypothetical protein